MGTFLGQMADVLPKLIPGAGYTIGITVVAVTLGILIGMVMALMKMSSVGILRVIANIYIEALRGTPLYVQIFLFHYGVASIIAVILGGKFSFPIMVTGVVVPALNSGAYVAEIFRAGIQSIDKGQTEAARSLGMTKQQTMRYVVLPQAFKVVIPPLGNEFVMLLKDTSLLAAIGLTEIMKRGMIYTSVHFEPFATYFSVALVYFVITFSITRLINRYERSLGTEKIENMGRRKRKASAA